MPKSRPSKGSAQRVTAALLRRHPLPQPSPDGDKEERGRVLIVGGESELPGAVILAGVAALRAGAGKLQIAACRSVAPLIGVAVPESLAIGLQETRRGSIAPRAARDIRDECRSADAILIGPGMRAGPGSEKFVREILRNVRCAMVLDAAALESLAADDHALHRLKGNCVITPHSGEMASLTGKPKEEIDADPGAAALAAAKTLRAVIALKGSETFIATPEGELFRYDRGDAGLATSGSGDTLAGIIAGLLARGVKPLTAALWGVSVHGSAGNALAKRVGRIGFLARELLEEIPALLNRPVSRAARPSRPEIDPTAQPSHGPSAATQDAARPT